MTTLYRPERLYVRGEMLANAGLLVDKSGYVVDIVLDKAEAADQVVNMPGRALLPGFVNAHSHSFQRLIRGKAESRVASGRDFWSWRGCMYHAAAYLSPEEIYDAARMAFLEMAMAGTTTVGEFHYLHTDPSGRPYDDPNLLAKQVIAAAESIGIRIVLLRTAYLRSGFALPQDAGQTRFIETLDDFMKNAEALISLSQNEVGNLVSFGVAPHSIRAVPLAALKEIVSWSRENGLPIHMHVAEQIAENEACVREYGTTPVALLSREEILGGDFTGVHTIHMDDDEMQSFAKAGATICSCPTTERNLGDGIVAAGKAMTLGIPFALGSDSQAQISPLEDARELEYHLRLEQQRRSILDLISGETIASRLFQCATANGAKALGVNAGELIPGRAADFFTVDLNDLSICGDVESDGLATIVFSLERTAIRDVAVQGRIMIHHGRHALQDEVIDRYAKLHRRVWQGTEGRDAQHE